MTHALAQIRNVAGGEVLERSPALLILWALGSNDSLILLFCLSFILETATPKVKSERAGLPPRTSH